MSFFKEGDCVIVVCHPGIHAVEVGDTGTVVSTLSKGTLSKGKLICFVSMDYPREGLTHSRPFSCNEIKLYSPFKKSNIFDVIEVPNG